MWFIKIRYLVHRKSVQQTIRYAIAGITTAIVNIAIYHFLVLCGTDYKIANIFAVIMCKIYGYVVNKLFVFRSHCNNISELVKELCRFVFARGFTALIDYFGLIIVVEVFRFDKILSKYIISVLVILLNYIFGKYMVFKNEREL